MQTSVAGAYKITYAELPFESLLSDLKLTPSLSQKTDQGHSLQSYNHSPQSSPGSSYSPYSMIQSKNPFPSAASWQMTLSVSQPSLLAETYFPGSFTHGPNALSSSHRELCAW